MENKKFKIAYWCVLMLFTVGILLSAVPSVMKLDYAVDHFVNILKLPEYLLPFTGWLKILGLVPLFIPVSPKIKEWSFAGFAFDLAGAWYCNFIALSFADAIPIVGYMVVLLALYYLYKRSTSASDQVNLA
ncbi:MAG TPA: DoxX family protein [Chryseolinea sp.]